MLIAAAVLFSVLTIGPHETAPENGAFPTRTVVSAIEKRLTATGAPGASVIIIHDGAIAFERGFGVQRLRGRAVNRTTHFEIGSLTKQFTAAAILQLKEQGKLSIEDRLAKYLPQFPHAGEITLRELLNQTSGLPDFMETNHFLHISHTSQGGFTRIERMAAGPLHFAPGSQWEYSNTNYIALGRVIEIVSRQSYDAYVHQHLFATAGMAHSTTVSREKAIPDMATGYWRGMNMKGPLAKAPDMIESWSWSAGDIVSTAEDIARWDVALASGKIINKADYALMTTPGRLTNGKTDDYAFHWWTDPLDGHALLSGLGDTYGFSACNDVFPKDALSIIVLENMSANPDGTSDAAAGVAAAAFRAIVAASKPEK